MNQTPETAPVSPAARHRHADRGTIGRVTDQAAASGLALTTGGRRWHRPLLVLGIASGLRNAVLDELYVIAYLNVERAFTAPTYVGDTIRARWTIGEIRPSRSRPDAGIVRLDCEVAKSDGTVVQHGADICLIGRRPQRS